MKIEGAIGREQAEIKGIIDQYVKQRADWLMKDNIQKMEI